MRWNKRALKLRWSWKMNTYKTCTQTHTHTHSEAKWKRNKVNSTTTSDIKSLKNYYFATQINPTHLSQVQHVHTLIYFVSKACFLRIYPVSAPLGTYLFVEIIVDVQGDDKKQTRSDTHSHTTYNFTACVLESRMYLLYLCALLILLLPFCLVLAVSLSKLNAIMRPFFFSFLLLCRTVLFFIMYNGITL